MFTVPQLSAVPCPRSRSLSSTRSLTFHRPLKGSEGVPGTGGELWAERDIWLGQPLASDLLDPAHPVLLGVFLQAGGLIAKNQKRMFVEV
jgi:hypothetical protein